MNKIITSALLLSVCLFFLSCSSKNESDNNQLFLEGLDALTQEDIEEASNLFLQASIDVNSTSASFAIEKLLPILYEKKEYTTIIEITENCFKEYTNTEIVYYQVDSSILYRYLLLAYANLKSDNVELKLDEWLKKGPFTKEHKAFISSNEYSKLVSEKKINETILERISIQNAVYIRDYGQAVRNIIASKNYNKNNVEAFFIEKDIHYLSDIGKALLYGSGDNIFFARGLEKAAVSYSKKSSEAFMCHFYAGRLYEDTGYQYNDAALTEFENAMQASTNNMHYDNALWYYLTTIRSISSRSAITALQEYAPTWKDAYYFDDFLDTLAFQLLDNENYKGFYALYEFLRPYMSPESLSKYAYISALLIENEYVSVDGDKKDIVKETYNVAYAAENGSLYYRIMAAVALDIPSSAKILDDLLVRVSSEDIAHDESFEQILVEMLMRGYEKEVYALYTNNSSLVRLETAITLSRELSLINEPTPENNYDNNYFPESLRLASRAFNQSEKDIPQEDMKLLYPEYYSEYVTQVSEVYNLEKFIIYAIMRSESFFDHDVESWAGAIGLVQLMPTTASDVARKLRVKEYDLHDARQNIDFGMFYFDELIPREGVDNSILKALFAYNAGITNVRRWVRQFPELESNPAFFLEKIPFAETREYGRKVLSAAVMYGLLHYDMEVEEVVNAIMN